MIRATIVGSDKLFALLESAHPNVIASLAEKMTKLMTKLEGYVKKDKLSGQVLKNQSGALRRSETETIIVGETGVVGKVGTNMEYAAYHEYGLNKTESVREHMRRAKAQAVFYLRGKNEGKVNLAATRKKMREQQPTIKVHAHTRKVEYPAHSFQRSALKDMQAEIMRGLRQAVAEGVAKR